MQGVARAIPNQQLPVGGNRAQPRAAVDYWRDAKARAGDGVDVVEPTKPLGRDLPVLRKSNPRRRDLGNVCHINLTLDSAPTQRP